jgi:Carbohydrate family 9 binding domain-like
LTGIVDVPTMTPMRAALLLPLIGSALLGLVPLLATTPQRQSLSAADLEQLPFAPRRMICYRTKTPLSVDGKFEEPAWSATSWSDPFVDIDGRRRPPLATRMKMLWDDTFLYIAAELEEPDVWATLTKRDSVIFQDNDFEVFIDPDGDTHNYYELEVNALGTAWDLMLVRPYRDGGPAIHAWDIAGLQVGVNVRGTINRPGDRDEGWTVEIALPWEVLREAAPRRTKPRAGDRWWINSSRVEWQVDARDGAYAKRIDPKSKRPLPEDNWVWSPQRAIDMHMPERWGIVHFTDTPAGSPAIAFGDDPNERVKWALRRLYYRQRDYRSAHGRYARELSELTAPEIRVEGLELRPTMQVTDSLDEIHARGFGGAVVHIRQDGRVWLDEN